MTNKPYYPENKTYHPISKYIGEFPKGNWVFVKYFLGTYEECCEEACRLQLKDPKTGRKKNYYKVWDER
jgi:hypothetical protein